MTKAMRAIVPGLVALAIALVATMATNARIAYADDTSGLAFDSVTVEEAESHTQVADLKAGEVPALKAGVTYALNVSYTVPSNLQFEPTYLNVYLGDGIYVTGLPGSTFTEGDISSTSFGKLIKTPTGTGTSPYGYPEAGSEKSRNGNLKYMTKNGLVRVDTKGEIRFRIDDAYENESASQTIADAIKVSLSTDETSEVDPHSYTINPADELKYGFWVDQATEVISKGGTTGTIEASNSGSGASLTEANSKTTVQLVYPKDIELAGLEETGVYKTNGTVVSTVEDGDNKIATIEWNEPGSYSGGLTFKPHLKVASDNARPNGSSFNVTLKNFKKTIWNDTPNVDRTSGTQTATMKVTIIDGDVPEKITTHALVDSAPNWALKKYDTYNTRLGAYLIKNELAAKTLPKTLEMSIDQDNTAIVRGVTIPYKDGMAYGPIAWTASDGTRGTADSSILQKSGVSALITNTALGLDIDTSITSIKVDLGPIPGGYDGIKPMQDILDTWNSSNKHVTDEYYGWSYISNGVYGSWKQGTDADVRTTVKLYTTGTEPGDGDVITGKSSAPEVLNGVGTIDKTQINGGESFKISGRIDDANWDWNPLQEPVLYVIMPEGFSYSDLNVTEGTLGDPEFVGSFDKNGTEVKVWKYPIDIGDGTRGQYQPNFSIKSMKLGMTVSTNKLAAKGVYHINDFVGFTTKDFKDIGAVIKSEKWDRSNWNTEKYTALFGDSVNSGKTMVSLSEGRGITVNQASEIAAVSTFSVEDGQNGAVTDFVYDSTNASSTTAVLQKGDIATVRIGVRNNAGVEASSTSLFVPLLSKTTSLGKSFTPEGKTQLPLGLVSFKTSSNYTVRYIKLNPGVAYDVNHAPHEGDYAVVSDSSEADMLLLTSTKPLGADEGGYVTVSYEVGDEVGSSYNGARDVFSTVLDSDIVGNHSVRTLGTNAVSFAGIDMHLTKVWKDGGNAGGHRPAVDDFVKALTLTSSADINLSGIEPHAVDNGDGTYTVSYLGLPKYKGNADNPITYTLAEGDIDHYAATGHTSIQGGGDVVRGTITNTSTETVDVSGTKTWDDDGDRDGMRPRSITVNLVRDGAKVDSRDVTADASGTWSYSFTGLPKFASADGHEYVYSVTEDAVANYATSIDGTSITNSCTPGRTSITVTKAWADANDQDGIRPASVKVQLYADGRPSGDPVELSAANQWAHTWTDLFLKENGKDVAYTVKEVEAPDGYVATIAGDAASGFTVTNAHEPETVSVPVSKRWVGGEGPAATVRLLADGRDTGRVLTLTSADSWRGSFDGLPKFRDGNQVAYTISEDAIAGYASQVSGDAATGFTVTNTKDETPGKPDTPSQGKPGSAPSLPRTGDAAVSPMALLGAALAVCAAGVVVRRRASAADHESTGRVRHPRG